MLSNLLKQFKKIKIKNMDGIRGTRKHFYRTFFYDKFTVSIHDGSLKVF